MKNHRTRSFSLAAGMMAVGLFAWSGFASAEVAPVSSDVQVEVEQAPISEPAPTLEVELDTADAAQPASTNYQCIAQCWRDFTDCLDHGNCSEEYCNQQRLECMSYC
ncbi:MAG: hypothetical protein AAF799_28655 [Myxococcota bacterium]